MKKITITLAVILLAASHLFANPDAKLLQAFNEAFPLAKDTKWHEDKNGYLVSFTQMGVATKVNYDKQGNYMNSLRYYDESKLPLNIQLNLKKRYPEKTVFGVTEFSNNEETVYHIKMQDYAYWYTVKATPSGSLSIEEKMKKGN